MLDTELRLVTCSDVFLKKFTTTNKDVKGKKLLKVLDNLPTSFQHALEISLKGTAQVNSGERFVLSNGNVLWLKWKIQCLSEDRGKPTGLMVVLEDITNHKKENELLLRAELVSRTGSWEVDLLQNKVYWSPMTKVIHEVPSNYSPTIETGINFYKEGFYRDLISELVNNATVDGTPWDTELIIITTKGREVWVRAKGEAEFHNGICIRISGTFQDIDEKKKIELKYKETTERLKVATNKANIGIWEYEISENKLIWDDNMYNLYGIKKETFSGVYNAWEAGVHPDDKENGRIEIAQAISGEKEFDTEFRVLWPNGAVKYIRAIAETQRDSNGNAIKMIGANWDITDSKEAEQRLRESAERLYVATTTANIGIWDLEINEKLVVCNDNMYNIYGIPRDASDVLEEWIKRIHPEDQERVQEDLGATIAEGYPFNTQFRGVRPNGEIIHLVAFGAAQRNSFGKIVKIIGANWDITELKSTQLKLERNKESFLDTFKNSAIGMALIGLDGTWLRVNKTICQSFGYTKEELSSTTFTDITYKEDLEIGLKLFHESLAGKRDSYQLEKRYCHKNGSIVYAIVNVTVVKDIYGKLSHLVAQVMDVTPQKEAEKQLKSLLEVTEVQNESLLNFAHIVSHNLRSHSSNMSMLTKFLFQENDEQERQNLQTMLVGATKSLSETIQHLNDVVQVKTDASENMRSMNLLDGLNHIENSIQGILTKENVITNIKVSKTHNVRVVPAYLDSILLNLYTNSLKYRFPTRDPILHISSSKKEDKIIIKFRDNGLGIDLKRHGHKLFGMYKTFHKHKEAKGIGLFITKNQIEAMNGTISVDSTVNVGTTFTITLEQG
jgi:PAS domain S-box-containing protein